MLTLLNTGLTGAWVGDHEWLLLARARISVQQFCRQIRFLPKHHSQIMMKPFFRVWFVESYPTYFLVKTKGILSIIFDLNLKKNSFNRMCPGHLSGLLGKTLVKETWLSPGQGLLVGSNCWINSGGTMMVCGGNDSTDNKLTAVSTSTSIGDFIFVVWNQFYKQRKLTWTEKAVFSPRLNKNVTWQSFTATPEAGMKLRLEQLSIFSSSPHKIWT